VLNEKQVKMTLTRNLNVPYVDQLLRLNDSLKLTPTQMDALHALSTRYLTTRDWVFSLVATNLDGPSTPDHRTAACATFARVRAGQSGYTRRNGAPT
jgi:hypothetical protein